MSFTKSLVLFSVANAVVLYLVHLLAGNFVVLGNATSSFEQALIATSVIVAIISSLVVPLANAWNMKFTTNMWMLVDWVANTLTIYLLSRIPTLQIVSGIGISSFWVAIVLGVLTNLAQYATLRLFGTKKTKHHP